MRILFAHVFYLHRNCALNLRLRICAKQIKERSIFNG
nr:MAG TPA: hypothetical protein [Caudoviricetes sp.]